MLFSDPQALASDSSIQPAIAGVQRERFGAEELAMVLSHYDVGVISEIRDFPRGSRKSPKLLIEAEHGHFLLKRRARGRDDAPKVAFSHLIQLHLAAQQFPLPHLIGTRRSNSSMLHLGTSIYELFEYIPGQGYPQTLDSTFESGKVLALYHKLLENFTTDFKPAPGSFHAAPSVDQGLKHIPRILSGVDIASVCVQLSELYLNAAMRVDAMGIHDWPRQIVHADWHPGNMLFREGRVVAVIDYDSARLLPRIIDVANGVLQFSIIGGDEDVSKWPEEVDAARFKRFIKGYDEVVLLSQAEVEAIPPLMIEALIAEAVFPIAQTGRFSRFDGAAFLKMVLRKTVWIRDHARQLVKLTTS